MGYDLHITRALQWVDSDYYPISAQEVIELADRSPDLAVDDGAKDGEIWLVWLDQDWPLRYRDGGVSAKNPPDPLVRRMIELAAEWDAWVIGEEGEVYDWDGSEIRTRERDDEDLSVDPLYLSRDGLDPDNPISNEEWLAAAAEQPDFRVGTTIEAMLPSGAARIPCPAVACWTGHPSGEPVWCFHDEDVVEVRGDDPDTVRRMMALAATMSAELLRWNGEPAR